MKKQHFLFLNIIIYFFSLLIFLQVYFPNSNFKSNGVPFKSNIERKVHRTVIMIIDALREDFVNSTKNMPYLNSLYKTKNCCYFPTRTEVPTVTLPRIKALTTGLVPNLIDVIANFGSNELQIDNILKLAHNDNQKIIFFGDNLWVDLFSKIFTRSDGTASLFITDFTEVDDNVTRHLNSELEKHDWDIMILHYLGLDHIGHSKGHSNRFIRPKLLEMDGIINKIHRQLKIWENITEQKTLFIVTTDHGMKDDGNHAGGSPLEINIPLISIGYPCASTSISQIDIAPTLSVLFGIPYPLFSIGNLIPGLLSDLSKTETLFVFESYYQHLVNLSNASSLHTLYKETNDKYNNLQSLLSEDIKMNKSYDQINDNDFEILYSFYRNEIKIISDHLVGNRTIASDLYIILLCTVSIILNTIALYLFQSKEDYSFNLYMMLPIIVLCNLLQIIICFFHLENCQLCNLKNLPIMNFLYLSIIMNFINVSTDILKKLITSFYEPKVSPSKNSYENLFIIAYFLQIILPFSTSYIQDEQYVWNYCYSTILIIIFIRLFSINCTIRTIVNWLLLLIIHRLIRELNITYNYEVPDNISTFYKNESNITMLTTQFVSSLILVSLVCKHLFKPNKFVYVLININLFIVYLYRASNGTVISILQKNEHSGILEAYLSFIISIIIFISIIISKDENQQQNYGKIFTYIKGFTLFWILINALLLRPHNVILLFVILWTSYQIHDLPEFRTCIIMFHYWMGKTFYFNQGITNSLSSLDLTPGYIGQTSYNPYIAGLLILMHTYCMPILVYLLLLMYASKNLGQNNIRHYVNKISTTHLLLISMSSAAYCIVMIVFQSHEFNWIIHSPKMVFDSVYACIIIICIIFSEIIFSINSKCIQ